MKNINIAVPSIVFTFLVILLSACSTAPPSKFVSEETRTTGVFSNKSLMLNSSSPTLVLQNGQLLTDNDDAFESKLSLIKKASHSIDLAYYIFADDYTSSTMSIALMDAAKRGVKVRMLLDYHSNYKNLDLFSMLESSALSASGSIEVRFYNRPTENQIKDSIYVTIGCGETESKFSGCSKAKADEMNKLLAEEVLTGDLKNVNKAGSGIFLSGLYAKNPSLMVSAIKNSYQIDTDAISTGDDPSKLEGLKELGKIYYQAKYGSGIDRILGTLKLQLAFVLYGEQVSPVYDVFSSLLPIEQANRSEEALVEWRHFSDFLHHKLLLVDGHHVQLGGRNVEDSYHMNSNPMAAKYIFMDTDVLLQLDENQANGLMFSFERLWNFQGMVATIADIRQHAPNDLLTTIKYASESCSATKQAGKIHYAECLETAMKDLAHIPLAKRIQDWSKHTEKQANDYRVQYEDRTTVLRSKKFSIDDGAEINYIENLPFNIATPEADLVRKFGAINEYEGENGKHIHAIWLAAFNNVCQQATSEVNSSKQPREIIIHNAYLFLPSNILAQLAKMVDGRIPCGNVNVSIITNSIKTTDLNIVNILSRHSMKAFYDHYSKNRHPSKGASIKYYEYVASTNEAKLSLHTKVEVFGDDLFVGSANADVRSYMMDSNNGLFIRKAPKLVKNYVSWVKSLINSGRVAAVEQYFMSIERDEMLKEDMATIDESISKYRAERWLKEKDIKGLKQHIIELLNQSYSLSVKIVSKNSDSSKAQAKFNSIFKTI